MRKYIFWLLLLPFIVYAESIEELIEKAIHNNPRLKAIENQLKAYKQKQVYEGSLQDPVVNISLNDIQLFYKPLSRNIEPMQTFNIGLSQKVPWLKKLKIKRKIVKNMYEETFYKLQNEKLNIIFNIYTTAFRYWQIKEKLKIVKDYKNVARHLIDFSNTLYSVGKVSQTAVFNAYTFYSKLLIKEENLKQQRKSLIERLKYLSYSDIKEVSIKPKKPFKISEDSKYIKKAYANNPFLLIFKTKEKESLERLKLAKLGYKPDFKFFASYSYRQGFRDYVSFGVSFNIPAWKKYRQDKKVLEEVFLLSKIKKELQDAKNKVQFEIKDTLYRINSLYETYKILNDYLLPQNQNVYESVISEYQVGKKNIFDVLTSLNQILDVKLKLIDETADYNIALKKLMKLTGELK